MPSIRPPPCCRFCEHFYSPLKLSLTGKQDLTRFYLESTVPGAFSSQSFLDIAERERLSASMADSVATQKSSNSKASPGSTATQGSSSSKAPSGSGSGKSSTSASKGAGSGTGTSSSPADQKAARANQEAAQKAAASQQKATATSQRTDLAKQQLETERNRGPKVSAAAAGKANAPPMTTPPAPLPRTGAPRSPWAKYSAADCDKSRLQEARRLAVEQIPCCPICEEQYHSNFDSDPTEFEIFLQQGFIGGSKPPPANRRGRECCDACPVLGPNESNQNGAKREAMQTTAPPAASFLETGSSLSSAKPSSGKAPAAGKSGGGGSSGKSNTGGGLLGGTTANMYNIRSDGCCNFCSADFLISAEWLRTEPDTGIFGLKPRVRGAPTGAPRGYENRELEAFCKKLQNS